MKTKFAGHGPSALHGRYGPTALITGASEGIGRAFAERLAEEGFGLTLVARRKDALAEIGRDLAERHGVAVRVIGCDLSQDDAVGDLLAQTDDLSIGLLVAAAGFGSVGAFIEQDRDTEVNMVDLNCRSIVELTHGLARRMVPQGRGGIVLFGSLVGFQGAPFSATYAATKGFVQSFARVWPSRYGRSALTWSQWRRGLFVAVSPHGRE
jgi:uncharacterized protein